MANNCFFTMRVSGREEKNIRELVNRLRGEGRIGSPWRVFSSDIVEDFTICPNRKDGLGYMRIDGDCAWSVKSSMIDCRREQSLPSAAEELDLTIEIFSSEPGCCFQEHYLILNTGDIAIEECIEYREICVEDAEESGLIHAALESNITPAMLKACTVEDGYIHVGGYREMFGQFEDPGSSFMEKIRPAENPAARTI